MTLALLATNVLGDYFPELGPLVEHAISQVRGQWVLYLSWGGMFFATFVLTRMLVTRWGESNVTRKALVLSLVFHLVAGLWTTTIHLARESQASRETAPIQIRKLRIEGEQQPDQKPPGNTPVWEKLPRPMQQELARLEKTFETPQAQPLPKQPAPLESPRIDVPDLPHNPNQSVAAPQSVLPPEKSPRTAEGSTASIDEETADSRSDVNVAPKRRTTPAPTGLKQSALKKQTRQGFTDDVAVNLKPVEDTASLKAPSDPAAPVLRSAPADKPLPRAGALPAPAQADPGVASATTQTESSKGSPSGSRFSRMGRPGRTDSKQAGAQHLRPNSAPQSTDTDLGTVPDSRAGLRDPQLSNLTPNLFRPDLDGAQKASKIPLTYSVRNSPQRKRIAIEMGATEDSERAVELSLRWLAQHQNVEGFWDADGFSAHCPAGDRCSGAATLGKVPAGDDVRVAERQRAGIQGDAGLTGLAVLAFLGAGYTHEDGLYADHLDRALRWLIRGQSADGLLGGSTNYYAHMYCHGMATIAIGEAYGMTQDTRLREPLARAVQYIAEAQNDDGGWRYSKGQRTSDMSMFGWQLMALKSARTAGLAVPPETLTRAIAFLKSTGQGQHGGLAGYRRNLQATPPINDRPTAAMTAEALFCRQILGMKRTNPASTEAVDSLLRTLPRRSEQDLYFWYYGTLAMFQYGSEPWRSWNSALRDTLVADQQTTGHAAGSWDPHAPWGDYGGRIFSTAMSTLCLEVYYRFLPLYQMGGPSDEVSGK